MALNVSSKFLLPSLPGMPGHLSLWVTCLFSYFRKNLDNPVGQVLSAANDQHYHVRASSRYCFHQQIVVLTLRLQRSRYIARLTSFLPKSAQHTLHLSHSHSPPPSCLKAESWWDRLQRDEVSTCFMLPQNIVALWSSPQHLQAPSYSLKEN